MPDVLQRLATGPDGRLGYLTKHATLYACHDVRMS